MSVYLPIYSKVGWLIGVLTALSPKNTYKCDT